MHVVDSYRDFGSRGFLRGEPQDAKVTVLPVIEDKAEFRTVQSVTGIVSTGSWPKERSK